MVGGPYQPRVELMELQTEPGEATESVLRILDGLLDDDPAFGVMYSNPRNSRYAYCVWWPMIDGKTWDTESQDIADLSTANDRARADMQRHTQAWS